MRTLLTKLYILLPSNHTTIELIKTIKRDRNVLDVHYQKLQMRYTLQAIYIIDMLDGDVKVLYR